MFKNENDINVPMTNGNIKNEEDLINASLDDLYKNVNFVAPVANINVSNGGDNPRELYNATSEPLNNMARSMHYTDKSKDSKDLSYASCQSLDTMLNAVAIENTVQYIKGLVLNNFCSMIDQIYYGEGSEFKYVLDHLNIKSYLKDELDKDTLIRYIIGSYYYCPTSYGNAMIREYANVADVMAFAKYTGVIISNNIYRIICKVIDTCVSEKYFNIYEYSRVNYENMIDKTVAIITECTHDELPKNRAIAIGSIVAVIKDMLIVNSNRIMRFITNQIFDMMNSLYMTSYYNFGLQADCIYKDTIKVNGDEEGLDDSHIPPYRECN